jgi:hypothetical protein
MTSQRTTVPTTSPRRAVRTVGRGSRTPVRAAARMSWAIASPRTYALRLATPPGAAEWSGEGTSDRKVAPPASE